MRITLVISSLGCGGAERVVGLLASHWASMGRGVRILTLDGPGKKPFFPTGEGVEVVHLDMMRPAKNFLQAMAGNLARLRGLRRALAESQADVVISFIDETNILVLLASLAIDLPVVVAVRNDPERYPPGRCWRTLRTAVYPLAHCIVVQTRDAKTFFSSLPAGKVRVIPNPVAAPTAVGACEVPLPPPPFVAAMGRLHPQKGFDILLRAFASLAQTHPTWSLVVFGEGPIRTELERLGSALGIGERVTLPGVIRNIPAHLGKADLFVMPSRFEGFPNALCEAMALGLPCIASDAQGSREILRNDIDGLIVPREDVDALARAMRHLMAEEQERTQFAARAPEILDRFSLAQVMTLWEEVLQQSLRPKKKPA